MKKAVKKLCALISAAAICFGFSSCAAKSTDKTSFAMGSLINAKLYCSQNDADALWNSINSAVQTADSLLSATNINSDISKINNYGTAKINSYTLNIIEECIVFAKSTAAKADITMGAVTKLWGFSTDNPSLPDNNDIAIALKTVDINNILVDEQAKTVSTENNAELDLGAFGKGAACDEMYRVLGTGNTPAVIAFGGTVLLFGDNPNNKNGSWQVGIRNPFATQNDFFATLDLITDTSKDALFISTSGSYEKSFEQNGVKYHHLLNPKTGYPVESELISVTAISSSGLTSDGLSTACYINGLNNETLQWLKNYSAEAVFVFNTGDYYVTDGIKSNFKLTAATGFTEYDYDGTN